MTDTKDDPGLIGRLIGEVQKSVTYWEAAKNDHGVAEEKARHYNEELRRAAARLDDCERCAVDAINELMAARDKQAVTEAKEAPAVKAVVLETTMVELFCSNHPTDVEVERAAAAWEQAVPGWKIDRKGIDGVRGYRWTDVLCGYIIDVAAERWGEPEGSSQ